MIEGISLAACIEDNNKEDTIGIQNGLFLPFPVKPLWVCFQIIRTVL